MDKTIQERVEQIRAGAEKPVCFRDLLKLQAKQDSLINNKRERRVQDICMSAIAEIVEFNEETKESHKTWAKHEYNAENEKKEAIDILFFFCQLLNKRKSKNLSIVAEDELRDTLRIFQNEETTSERIFTIVSSFTSLGVSSSDIWESAIWLISHSLGCIYASLGMDFSEVLERYWDKWNTNLDRISGKVIQGKEWL